MATTENGIYYPNDGKKAADVLADLKAMAESIDKNIQENKFNDKDVKKDISDIKKEQETQNSDIENLQTNDNKQDELISKLKSAALNAETEEAKSLHVTDANRFGSLEVLGNHEQETRSGKNKLNLANIQQTTKNGITCTYNEDGSVTFDGTCTADNTSFAINNININAVKNQTIMSAFYEKGSISAQEEKTAYIYARINTSDYSKMLSFIIADLNNSNPVISEQYKSDDALLNQFSFRIEAGTILNNFTVKVMVTDTPEEATEYEQYGASPSPEYPSPVVCLEGSTKISKINKNIMPILNLGTDWECTEKGIKNIESNNGKEITNFFIKKGEKVEIGLNLMSKPSSESTFSFIKNGITDSSLNFTAIQNYTLNTVYKKTYMADEDTIISLKFWGNANNDTFEFQLWAEYNELTDYIKHQQTDYILNIQQEMLEGDYFVKEADGWKEVHSYSKKIFNGTEAWNLESLSQGNNFYTNIPDALGDTTAPVYSNCFMYCNGLLDKNYSCRISGSKNLNLRCNEKNTAEEFKQMLADKYNAGNPVYFYYKTATPTKLACTEEQSAVLEELNNMDLFEGVNNIITAEDIALLKLKYALDVETYIDNKLNTINQQILNIAGGN